MARFLFIDAPPNFSGFDFGWVATPDGGITPAYPFLPIIPGAGWDRTVDDGLIVGVAVPSVGFWAGSGDGIAPSNVPVLP